MKNLPQKTIVITGASSGIGEAAARLCAARGALPILVARLTRYSRCNRYNMTFIRN